jgi:hypothetical protein
MHKRFGFKREGYFRQHVVRDGLPEDVVFLAILRAEWESIRPDVERKLAGIEGRLKERGYLAVRGAGPEGS